MAFEDEFISEKQNSEKPDAKKTLISNDAYAIGKMLHVLLIKIQEILRKMDVGR